MASATFPMHGIDDSPVGGPHNIDIIHYPGPGYDGGVQCHGGDDQYPALGGGPHGIDDPLDASPHDDGHVRVCPSLVDPPYGIVIDVWALLDPSNSLMIRIYNLTIIKTR
jgi:hypothetical protein